MTYRLRILTVDVRVLDLLREALQGFNGHPIHDPDTLLRLPGWLWSMLVVSYRNVMEAWQSYVVEELESFAKSAVSRANWAICREVGIANTFKLPLSSEQRLWVLINKSLDLEDEHNTILQVRESLLPWLNPEMYKIYEKTKEKRTNVDYERQRREMVEGSFDSEQLDIIN